MARRKTWSKFKKLTGSIAQSLKRQPAVDNSSFTASYTADSAPPSTIDLSTTSVSISYSTPNMAEEQEDPSSLPITDRWVHKVWKIRKEAYEEATASFEKSPDEYAPVFKPFLQDPGLWKGAVADSNVAAQQEGIAAYCAFLKYGGKEHGTRSRGTTVTPLCEKGLPSTRAATKTATLEALLLLCELDVPGPVIEDILPVLSAKQPKTVAAVLNALTGIFHNFGCKIADPKPVLKVLPKAFGHADKNVRAEATNLAVEFYRWLREAMKPMFWGDLKPTQQSDLEAQFEKIKAEGAPKQERLLRSQQAAREAAPAAGGDEDFGEADEEEEAAEIDAFDLAEPQDIIKKIPADFYDRVGSSKWKDRKEALEALYAIVNVPRIKDGDFGEVNRVLAKSMKDANIACVTQAAQCIELLAKGMRKAYAKYRSTVMQPIMERLKEKKASVSDALGAALDQVFLATNLTECLEDILAFLVNKNPQVKEGTMKFLVRCLRTTREVPSKAEIGQIVDAAKKLLAESSPVLREGGAETLGTIMKIIGERAMNPHMEGLDDIRKGKIKEFYETAEVKAKEKPKAPPPAAKPPPGPAKKMVRKVVKKPAAAAAAAAPPRAETPPPAPQPAAKPAGSKMAKPGLGGMRPPQKKLGLTSPRRAVAAAPPPVEDTFDDPMDIDEPDSEPVASPPRPRMGLGMGRGGLAGRSLAKPAMAPAPFMAAAEVPPAPSGLTAIERAELEELRDANERLMRQIEEHRNDRSKLLSEIQELKIQNAGLIEDHTRDVLSIKAKETQLVRARSDAEAAEGTNDRLRRELDRLKRALGKAEQLGVQRLDQIPSPHEVGSPIRDLGDGFSRSGSLGHRASYYSNHSEERDNGDYAASYARHKALSPDLGRFPNGSQQSFNSGRASPAIGSGHRSFSDNNSSGGASGNGNGAESWKRAAEVTSQLKARIEQMKAKQSLARQ
ncbi:armadillo-type protein [Coniella lustricola]|uniref:Armadillo-type protein n=1 Tax=Coniella lustricola TaxID=2025994 RepID=A0A2T3AGK9_9PEZI|nr:armadillo-type protein [Coniella lustricola]